MKYIGYILAPIFIGLGVTVFIMSEKLEATYGDNWTKVQLFAGLTIVYGIYRSLTIIYKSKKAKDEAAK